MRARGFTLIEVILFIAVAGIVASVLVQVFGLTGRDPQLGKNLAQATDLAQQRMEVISGQRRAVGYTAFTTALITSSSYYDPCQLSTWSGAAVCSGTSYSAVGAYTVTSTPPAPCPNVPVGSACVTVTVTVTDPYGATAAVLTRQFWDY